MRLRKKSDVLALNDLFVANGELDDHGTSDDDKGVLALWENDVDIKQGHYTVPIPETPDLPDNKGVVFHRLNSSYRCLDKLNTRYRCEEGIQEKVDKGYAQNVPDDDNDVEDGRTWYIPNHHDISEAKNGKLRMVMSLSKHWQSSDYVDELCRLRQGDTVLKSSNVVKLDSVLHEGMLVVGGRLSCSALPEQT